MTYTSAAFDDVAGFGGRVSVVGDFRRAVAGGVILGVGSVSAVAAAVGMATVTAAWLMSTALATNPNLHVGTPMALETIAPGHTYRTLAGTAALIAAAPLAAQPANAPDLVREAELTPAPTPTAAPARAAAAHGEIPLPPQRPPERANQVPLPPQRPFDVGSETVSAPRAPAQANALELAARAIEHASETPSSPRRPPERTNAIALALPRAPKDPNETAMASAVPERANEMPVPPPPAQVPQAQAKEEDVRRPAPSAVSETKPQSASSALPLPGFTFFKDIAKRFSPQLAYNSPKSLPHADSHTAVYDIVAHTVYLPDGERLEAHSGLGYRLDDPRYVDEKGRGPTPPHVYDLVLREAPFHGVRALRLNPVGDGAMYGRGGILAHTYMLGPSGQSFGCVSFRDYSRFLHAFLAGEINRILVVAHLGNAPAGTIRARREREGGRYAFN